MSRSKGTAKWAQYKNKKRLSRRYAHYWPNANYQKLAVPKSDEDRDNLIAPKEFSILTNRNEVIEYFEKVVNNFHDKKYSIMNMNDIKITDLATIGVVISMMMDRRSREGRMRKYVNVRIPPVHTEAGRLFKNSQFHQTVTRQGIADHTFFLSRRSTKVNVAYVGDVLKSAGDFLGKNSTEYLSPILVELMQNTNNHANPSKAHDDMDIPWFLAVLEDDKRNRMIFTIVDLGVGIFESLKLKNLADTSNQFDDAITDMYDNSQSKFLATHIPKGVDSSTGLFYRGQGLKTVYERANEGNYDTFKVVTNRALVDILNTHKVEVDSGVSFGGTVYYWEMSKDG